MGSFNRNIDLLLKRNDLSFKDFFDGFYPALVVFAEKFVTEREVAEDLAQEAFIKVYESDTIFEELDNVKAYLYTTVRNKSINKLRHDKIVDLHKNKTQSDNSSEAYFMDALIEQEAYRILYQAVESLPKQSRKIIKLGMKGFTNPEIAKELNISVNTVKTLKLKSYRTLRILLKDHKLALLVFLSIMN